MRSLFLITADDRSFLAFQLYNAPDGGESLAVVTSHMFRVSNSSIDDDLTRWKLGASFATILTGKGVRRGSSIRALPAWMPQLTVPISVFSGRRFNIYFR
jgi:hypothetical protein